VYPLGPESELIVFLWLAAAIVATLTRFALLHAVDTARGSLFFEMLLPLFIGFLFALVGQRRRATVAQAPIDEVVDVREHERVIRHLVRFSRVAIVILTALGVAEIFASNYVPGRWILNLILLTWTLQFYYIFFASRSASERVA
jgi:hypothetical protein